MAKSSGAAAFEALRECACAVQRGDLSRADFSMKRALDLAEDDHSERLVKYFAQALARRAYRLLPKYPPDFRHCYFDDDEFYPYTAAKLIQQDTIGKAVLSGKSKLHLIFFSLNFFKQETLSYMEELRRLGKVLQMCLKVTFIDTSNSRYITTEFDSEFDYLRNRAEGIKFEFNRVGVINQRLDELDVSRLNIDRDDEFVVVNCFFLLGYMLPVALYKFLVMLRDGINPDVLFLTECDANLNQNDFLPRFDESFQYYSDLYSFLDKRYFYGMVHHLQNEIFNVVAHEGGARVVRHMTSHQWRDLLNKSGFSSIPILYDNKERVHEYYFDCNVENGCLKISGKGQERPLFFSSAWKIKESSFDQDFCQNSLDGDDIFQNLPISPDPQHHSLIRMASLTEVLEMTYQKFKDYKDEYHMRGMLVWEKCEDNHHAGRSSQLNPCLCIVEHIGFTTKFPKYHLQERSHVITTFESNQPCFVPHITNEEKGLSYLITLDLMNGVFAIKLSSVYANCEGYVVEVLFAFPEKMRLEERRRVMEKILSDLRHEKSFFVNCRIPDDFLDELKTTSDDVRIVDNQSHNNVMDMNVPLLQLPHQSSTPNAMPTIHQTNLVDYSSFAELLNLNEVSSTPSAKPARDQSLLSTNIDTKEVSIKRRRKRKIEPPAPSTSKKNKSLIWDHVKKVEGEVGNFWVICNHCGFKRKHNSKQGTTVWKNHLEKLHDVKFKNVQESPQLTGVEYGTTIEKFKDANCGPGVPTNADQTTELVDQLRSFPWSTRNETQVIPISSANCKKVSPAHDISEETEIMLVKGTNWSFDEQSDHENSNGWKIKNQEFEDCPSEKVVFTDADIAAGSKPWENALVGYVLGLKPTLAEMTCFAKTEWERFEVPKVFLVDDGVFLFAFESPDKKRIVWESQWAYSGHLLALREWTCDLDVLNVEVLRRVPIWVEFHKLPLFLWKPESLGRLARHLGRPLAIDKSTKNPQNQLKCARVLVEVEVDTMDKLPESIPVDLPWKSFNQSVVFDRESVLKSFMASKKAGGTTEASSSHGSKGRAKEMKEPISTWSEEDVRNYLICPFTSEELNRLERWKKNEPIGSIVNTMPTMEVKDSLARLVPPQGYEATESHMCYIDDTVMDSYFEFLKKMCDTYPNKYLKHYSFSCLTATKIFDGEPNILKPLKLEKFNGVRKLFLPLRLPEISHWVLFYANLWDRQLLWLDPVKKFQKSHEKEMKIISEWFRGKLLPRLGYNDARNWEVKIQEDIPTQENDFDCGVFVMKYADCLTHGDHFPFSQDDMIHFRERIFLDLVKFWTYRSEFP